MTRLPLSAAFLVLASLATTSRAADRTVTEARDVPSNPLPGSLRAVLASASAGDRIRFAVASPVEIAGDVAVPANVAVVGPVAFTPTGTVAGAIVVDATAVRLQGVDFGGVRVRVESGGDGVSVLGCRFRGPHGGLTVSGAKNTQVGTLRRPNRFVGFDNNYWVAAGVVLDSDQNTTILANSFGGSEGGVLTKFSGGLTIAGNVFRCARVDGNPETATVTGNRFLNAPCGGNSILLRDYPDRPLPGLVSVVANYLRMGGGGEDGISVSRQTSVVVANRVTGPRAALGDYRAIVVSGVSVRVAGNIVRGASQGIMCLSDDPAAELDVEGNVVSGIRGHALAVSVGAAGVAHVTANIVRANLFYPYDHMAGLALSSYGGAIDARLNTSTSSAEFGFEIFAMGGTIDMTDNLIARSASNGVIVRAGDGLVRASGNAVLFNGGDGYHFDAGSHGEVSVSATQATGNAGEAVLVEDGAFVVRND